VNKLENQQKDELLTVVAEHLNGGFFSLEIEKFSRQLTEKLAWIKSVSVKKVWPDKLQLTIIEYTPVVRWQSVNIVGTGKTNSQSSLISQYGVIFKPELTQAQQKKFNSMVVLTGSDDSAGKVLLQCMEINKQLKQLALGIKHCGMNNRRSWTTTMVLKDGQNVTLKLGKREVMKKLTGFIDIFSGRLKRYLALIDYADLRYSNGFTIFWNKSSWQSIQPAQEGK